MPGTVITFPVRGAGVVILLFGPKPFHPFLAQKTQIFGPLSVGGLGVARAGRQATGGGHLGSRRASAPLARAHITPILPLRPTLNDTGVIFFPSGVNSNSDFPTK